MINECSNTLRLRAARATRWEQHNQVGEITRTTCGCPRVTPPSKFGRGLRNANQGRPTWPPRSMASKVAVNRLRKEYRCLPRIAAPRIAVLPQSTPRHLLRRPATVATAVTVATASLAASSAALPATATGSSNRRRSFAPRRSRATCRSGTTCCRAHLTHHTLAGCNTAHGQKCPSPRAISHRPRGRACSGSASAPERKAPRCFSDHGEPWRALAPRTR